MPNQRREAVRTCAEMVDRPRVFSKSERAEIATLLGLDTRADVTRTTIEWLQKSISEMRATSRRSVEEFIAEAREEKLKRPRGNSHGAKIDRCAECIFLAHLYQDTTGKRITTTRHGAFYRLAQICLTCGDPTAMITAIRRPPWTLREPRQQVVIDRLADASEILREVLSQSDGASFRRSQ